MVKKLSPEDKAAIEQAIRQANRESSAELAVIITRASDEYRAVSLIIGLVLGTLLATLLWRQRMMTEIYSLFCVQLAVTLLFVSFPFLRHLCLRFEPARILHRRAAERAAAEYMHLTHHLAASVPVILLYVSLAERYVHIYASRCVREKIPDVEWHAVVRTLTTAVKREGVREAMIKVISHASDMLKTAFPPPGRKADI
jgi:putative membrane protein